MKCKKIICVALMLLAIFLSSCRLEEGATPSVETTIGTGEQNSTEAENVLIPVVTEIAPSSRCALTSNGKFAETDMGYFMVRDSYLYYADKADLSNWVLVCNRPECNHSRTGCQGSINFFWMDEDGIYYVAGILDGTDSDCTSVICMSLDDFSKQVVLESAALNTKVGAAYAETVVNGKFYNCMTVMAATGTLNYNVVEADQKDASILYSTSYPDSDTSFINFAFPMNVGHSIRGSFMLKSLFALSKTTQEEIAEGLEDQSMGYYYQFCGDELRPILVSEECGCFGTSLFLYGAYIQEDACYHYHPNDGFYYMDLSTGQEVKIADAAYENAYGHCVDGQYMIESTLSVPGYPSAATEPRMRYFDGETWQELELPDYWNTGYALRVLAGTSDRIFFTVDDDAESYGDRQQELCCLVFGEDSFTVCDKYPCSPSFD